MNENDFQIFLAIKDNITIVAAPQDLSLLAFQGYEIWQIEPERKLVARAGHPEDTKHVAIYPNGGYIKDTGDTT